MIKPTNEIPRPNAVADSLDVNIIAMPKRIIAIPKRINFINCLLFHQSKPFYFYTTISI